MNSLAVKSEVTDLPSAVIATETSQPELSNVFNSAQRASCTIDVPDNSAAKLTEASSNMLTKNQSGISILPLTRMTSLQARINRRLYG